MRRTSVAPKVIWHVDRVSLRRYDPPGDHPRGSEAPRESVVIVPDLFAARGAGCAADDIGRELGTMPGLEVLAVDWGPPARADRLLTLADYAGDYLAGAIGAAMSSGSPRGPVHLLGQRGGGILALCQAALRPSTVRSLILLSTEVDFGAGDEGARPDVFVLGSLPGWSGESVAGLMELADVLPPSLSAASRDADPSGAGGLDAGREGSMSRLERPGQALGEWTECLLGENRLARGRLTVNGRVVDLGRITCPVLNVVRRLGGDRTPRDGEALASLVASEDYTERPLPGGGDPSPGACPFAPGPVVQLVRQWLESRFAPERELAATSGHATP